MFRISEQILNHSSDDHSCLFSVSNIQEVCRYCVYVWVGCVCSVCVCVCLFVCLSSLLWDIFISVIHDENNIIYENKGNSHKKLCDWWIFAFNNQSKHLNTLEIQSTMTVKIYAFRGESKERIIQQTKTENKSIYIQKNTSSLQNTNLDPRNNYIIRTYLKPVY